MIDDSIKKPWPRRIPYWRLMTDLGAITPEILENPYAGAGTSDNPFIVEWMPNDPRKPIEFASWLKWAYTVIVAFAVLIVSLASSAYAGSLPEIIQDLDIPQEAGTLGVSVFVFGFAVGPLFWAPLSEAIGCQVIFVITFLLFSALCADAAGCQNTWSLTLVRFLAGAFGSSPLTNAGGVIADIFDADQRGLATSLFVGAPFLGPTLGPVIGGCLSETAGWQWVQGFLAIFAGLIWLVEMLCIPETYAPLLIQKRAERLSSITTRVYRSKLDIERGKVSFRVHLGLR